MSSKLFDSTVKDLVEVGPADWPAFVGQPTGPTEVIDADIATVSGAADKVLRVHAAEPYLLHLEFVAGHDAARLPGVLHVRNALLLHRHGLPVRSVGVLLRPEADSPALAGEWRVGFRDQPPYLVFRYGVVRVWQVPPEDILAGGVATLPLALISATTAAQLPAVFAKLKERLGRKSVRKQANKLWSAAYLLAGIRFPLEVYQKMFEELNTLEDSASYQFILEKGVVKGELKEAKKFLLLLASDRFGTPDAHSVAALDAVQDLTQLEMLGLRLKTVNSWQELVKPLPKPRRAAGRKKS